jgi:hypothetical protein
VGHCGSSGRSPVPHLHFQFQATPQTGSGTIALPVSHYILKAGDQYRLKSSGYPMTGEMIGNIEPNDLLKEAYNFIPGSEICFARSGPAGQEESRWDVTADVYNNTFLFCRKTGAKAFFKNDGDMIWFTHFEGNKKSLLYYFFLANYKVIFGFYRNLGLEDHFPLHLLDTKNRFLQDFIAPFHVFTKSTYSLTYLKSSNHLTAPEIMLRAEAAVKSPLQPGRHITFEMIFKEDKLQKFTIFEKSKEPEEWLRVIDM